MFFYLLMVVFSKTPSSLNFSAILKGNTPLRNFKIERDTFFNKTLSSYPELEHIILLFQLYSRIRLKYAGID